MTTRELLLDAALAEFSQLGYLGASLQTIGDRAGTSKSSVLYHFTSKEALLDAVLQPAIDALGELFTRDGGRGLLESGALLGDFVDLLMQHREAVSVFITQRGALGDVPVIRRGNELIDALGSRMVENAISDRTLVRLSVALAGAAFILTGAVLPSSGLEKPIDDARMRELLVETLRELAEVSA